MDPVAKVSGRESEAAAETCKDAEGNVSPAAMARNPDAMTATLADLFRRFKEKSADPQRKGRLEADAAYFLSEATSAILEWMSLGCEQTAEELTLKMTNAAAQAHPEFEFFNLPFEQRMAYWCEIMELMVGVHLRSAGFGLLNAKILGASRDHWRQLLLCAYQHGFPHLHGNADNRPSPLDDPQKYLEAIDGLIRTGLAEEARNGSINLTWNGRVLAHTLLSLNKPE